MEELLSREAFETELRARSRNVNLVMIDGTYEDLAVQCMWVGLRLAKSILEADKEASWN